MVAAVALLLSSWAFAEALSLGHPHHPRAVPRFGKGRGNDRASSRRGGGSIRQKQQKQEQGYDWEVRWYEQRLDHFTARNATFLQKFLFAPQWWKGPKTGAPIFLYCGNEGNIEWFAENSGFIWEIAPAFGALLVFPEHRYYGDSMPFGTQNASYKDADSLTYLSSEQALADYVVLITDLKKNLSAEDSPVVLFGGSYGGMLAAWFRLKYPHIAIGALASSAPILQFEGMASPYTFYDTVSKDFRTASESCYQTIKGSWDILASIGSTKEGLHDLTVQFGVCTDLESVDDLTGWIESAYDYVAMVDYPVPANFTQDLPAYPIKAMCKALDGAGGGANGLDGIAAAMNVYYNFSGSLSCFDLSDDPHGLDGWGWQACTEMVMPMSIRANSSMFPPYTWDMGAYEKYCMEAYGVMPRPHWVGEEFGGQDITAVLKRFGSNIVFSNGLLDPWSGGGVLNDISETLVALVTEDGAHHLDLRAADPADPEWLIVQRLVEVAHIDRWLREYSSDRQTAR